MADPTNTMVKEAVLHNFSAAAASYFVSIRVPASLVAGSSLGALFSFTKRLDRENYFEMVVVHIYHALVLSAFCLALTTIIICTAASVTMLHGRFDPMAETAYQLLRREFDYEFSVSRWCFLVALLCFISGVTSRIILEFDLLERHKTILVAVVSVMVALTANMLSYINRTLYCWPNLWQMTIHVMKLLFEESLKSGGRPLQLLSLVASLLSFVCMLRLIFMPFDQHYMDKKKAKKA